MVVSYKKLWHILLDRDMKKKDLEMLAGISHYTMSKMSRDENVTTEVLGKVCMALDCKVEDMGGCVQKGCNKRSNHVKIFDVPEMD